jgi:hypothetical protein
MNLQEIINYSVGESTRLNDKALSMKGMSSKKVRNLLNKVVSYPNTKYLEVGVWNGSTFYSALYNNEPTYAVAIDNFSEFEGQEKIFLDNISDIKTKYTFINRDCFSVNKDIFEYKFNVYFYDGGHSEEDQEKALTYYYECMEDTFLYICDDYNWERVQRGTKNGIEKCNLNILEEKVILSKGNSDLDGFWNGIYIGILQK